MAAQSGEARPHVVVLPVPSRGHINPMMHFCKMLAAQGVSITFINSEYNDKFLADAQRQALQRLGIRLETLPDGLPNHLDRAAHLIELSKVMLPAMSKAFDAILTRLFRQHPTPTCILADTYLSFTLPAASKFGLPHASLWTQSAASLTSLLMISNGSYTGPSQGEPHIPGADFLKEEDMNTFLRCYDQSDFMFRFVTNGLDSLDQSRWVFINTFKELESETLNALSEQLEHIHAIGPLLPSFLLSHNNENDNEGSANNAQSTNLSTIWVEEEECLNWLDQFEPKSVVYVSFGSLALITSQQLEELALGLEASGHPFLWVARPNSICGESPNFNETFLERVNKRAYFVSWAPQLKVLSHKSIGGFFTHGGWNSTLEGISTRIPMLGWPYFSDQPMNCKCIEEGWKIGLRLRKGETKMLVPRDVVEVKVKELMCSDKFLIEANECGLLAKKAALQGGSSFKEMKEFVKTLKHLAYSNS